MFEGNSTIDKIAQAREGAADQQIITKEKEAEFKKALNQMMSSTEGKYVAKYLLRYLGVFAVAKTRDPVAKLEHEIRRQVYLEFLRPYLERDLRMELENQ